MLLYQSVGPNPRVATMYLAETGFEVPRRFVDVIAGENRRPDYLAKNPAGHTPALELDDGTVIAESLAIAEYLDERLGPTELLGDMAEARAATRMMARMVDQLVVVPMTIAFRGAEGHPVFKDRVACFPEAAASMKSQAQDGLAKLDRHLGERDFLCGDRFSLADILLFAFVEFGGQVGQPTGDRPSLQRWQERVATRPSAAASADPTPRSAFARPRHRSPPRMSLSRDTLLDIYRRTMKIARFDEKMRSLLTSGKLAVVYYTVRGQELVSAAMMAALNKDDYIVTTYRGQHDQIAKGVPLDLLLAEIIGREAGTCKGKGGSMHITHPKSGVMVTTGVVGSGLPIANGLALSSQNRGDGRVTVACFGDGASNIGAFHEAMNMAALYRLPVVFFCQNNHYGEHTAFADHTRVDNVAKRADSYGMPGVRVDGNDVEAMYGAAREAVERARAGDGPTLIEAMCYRMMGHFFGADFSYMPADHLAEMKEADPLPRLRKVMLDHQFAEAELDAIVEEIDAEIEAAEKSAFDSPPPGPKELRRDIFAREIAA
jgi:pyruvate dehydrogenase E1 component alpha subunit